MLAVIEDTTEGVHDTLIAACDRARYRELGAGEEHRNCAENLVEGLAGVGRSSSLSSDGPFSFLLNP